MTDLNTESFMKSLFMGEIREDLIFPYPEISPEVSETVEMIKDSVGRFAKEHVQSEKWDQEGKMPKEIISHLSEMGMMGLAVSEEMGGIGLPQSGYVRVMQEVGAVDASLAVTLGAHQSIGYKALILFGTDEQKKKWLPKLASGQLIACYCLTEPSSGSDAASIQSKATLSSDGSYYELTGNKLWITNGGIANFLTIFAKTDVVEKGETREKVTCFVLELPAEGVQVGPEEHKLGIKASWTNAIHFDKVKIPKENVIGEVGKGFKVAMGVLNHGRLGLAAGAVGLARKGLEFSVAHANERVQFKKRLREFGMIKEKIARMSRKIYAAESMIYMTTSLMEKPGVDYSIESAIAKIYATEMCWETIDETIQIWGGAGYMREYPFERWMRDNRIFRIFEGTNEILRAFVALSGMQGPGEELAGLAEAIKYPLKGLGPVTDFAIKKIKRNVFGARINESHNALKKLAGVLEDHTVELSSQVELLLRRHGKKIHLRQLAQKRIADSAIDLYAMFCVLSRVTTQINKVGLDQTELERSMAEAFFRQADRRVEENFRQLDKNEDDMVHYISDQICDTGQYPFGIMG